MMDTDMTGSVQTVLGPVSPGDLGVTLTHEHLLIDLGFFRQPPPEASLRARFAEPVSLSLLGLLKQTGAVNVDNGRLLDLETAQSESFTYNTECSTHTEYCTCTDCHRSATTAGNSGNSHSIEYY